MVNVPLYDCSYLIEAQVKLLLCVAEVITLVMVHLLMMFHSHYYKSDALRKQSFY